MSYLSIKKKLYYSIEPENVLMLAETFSFLQEEVSLTNAVIDTIRVRRFPWSRFVGPNDGMYYCTFGEFTKAQVRFDQYEKTKDPASLDAMVAVLFRKKKLFWFLRRYFTESTDPRVRFIDRTLAARTKQIQTIPTLEKYAVMLFFSGVQSAIAAQFPNVYRQGRTESNNAGNGWASLVISLADGKTDDQSLDRVMHSNLYNVFFGLEQKAIEYFDFIKKHPSND